ncbi:multi-sensor signal transduction histidine kinase [Candidatus Vecturithrix granuli]|uniref:histidine kinase n=1 Tax=Vecturithrix granuli TaxID=1499967 RepID=A0A081C6B7_VECG1|nr:multi-sensor signal transduction histidine kinase [Candidatus Vecturithrix granuli]
MSKAIDTAHFDKILVVDDATANLQLLTNLLTEHGYTVYPASDGELALEFVQSTLPDLILLDIRMRGMDGYEVCRQLKAAERTRAIPIIFISILEGERDKVKGFQAGAVDYITKPFQPEEVLARVRLHLRLRELTEHLEQTVAERTAKLHDANAQLQIELAERKGAEEALEKERNLLRTLITNMPDYVYVKDRESRFVLANAASLHAFGAATVEELAGKTDFDFLPQEYAEKFYTDEQAIIASGDPLINCEEQSIELHTGRPVWFSTTKVPLRDPHGDVTGIIGVTRDITDRKRVEEALRRERMLIANIMETSPIGITTVDVNGQITFANTQAIKILGLTKAEIVQRTYDSPAWHITDFAGNPFPVEELPFVRVMTTGQAVHDIQHAIEWPDGQRVLLSINAAPLKNEAGQIEGMVAVISDITEHKRAEEALRKSEMELREAQRLGRFGSWDWDAVTDTITWSEEYYHIYGFDPTQRPPGYVEHLQAYTPESAARLDAAVKRNMETGEPYVLDLELARPDGPSRWITARSETKRDASGRIVGLRGTAQDITERKRAEEVLRVSEERYRMAQAIGHVGNWEYNLQTTQFWGSDEAKRIYGFDPEQANFSTDEVENCIPERERVHQALVDLIEAGKPYNLEFEIRPLNSSEPKIITSIAELQRDEHGDPLKVIGVIQDVTTRKRAEEALQRERTLLANIMETSPIGITTVDVNGQITFANAQAIKILGLTKTEIVQRTYDSPAWHITDFAGNPFPVEELPFVRVMTTGQAVHDVQHAIEWPDGQRVLLSINAAPLKNEAGQIEGMVAVISDITERKRAEEDIRKLSRAVEHSPAAIVITNTAGNIEYVNPKFTQITEYSRDEAIGKNPRILKSGETPPEEYQRLWETITHGDVWRGEFHNKKKNDELYWESASISPVIDAQGNITHFVAIKEDITTRKQAEEALRILNEELELRVSQRTAELEAANKELQEFAHIVSHDLKAPLRGISRLTQWLREDYADTLGAQGQEQFDLLGEQVKRMDTLIDGILRYSKAVHGSEREESFDLNTLVSQVIEVLMPPAHITIRLENTLPIVHGDPIQLMQVFQNLLSNAMKFMDKPIGKITVASEDAGDMWIFRIEDNGPGIEPRHHERIFKIFQSGTARDARESTGIGLAVVKKIIELYGGRVWVESTPGHGSRFSFTWPKRTNGED